MGTVRIERVICLECGWTYARRTVGDPLARRPSCPSCGGRSSTPASMLHTALDEPLRRGSAPGPFRPTALTPPK
jgi:NAD-dependent SIR2 family protein deacetylase